MPDADDVFADWQQNADGVWTRHAARVIVVDGVRRVLLMRGFDVADVARTWWFTPGGGLGSGESEVDTAIRELFEESGLRVRPADLVGPVAERTASFPYFGRSCRQSEVLFFVRLDADHDVHTDGWTAVERASVSEMRWWDVDELEASGSTIYPPALPSLARALGASGWDGIRRAID